MLKFARPFSTFSALFKEAATKTKAAAKPKTTKKKATTAKPKPKAKKKAAKPKPYKPTKEDRNKHGKLNKTELKRLFIEKPEPLNPDRVRLLRRHVHYYGNRDRLPAYNAWMKDELKNTTGLKLADVAKKYKAKSDSEKAAIAEKYRSNDDDGNVYTKFDYTSIRYPKLSGLNVYLRECLKDVSRVFADNKLKEVVVDWTAMSEDQKKHYNDMAKKENESNAARLEGIYAEAKKLYEDEILLEEKSEEKEKSS
ncbi:hypothetical protein CKK34_6095 [Yarrowia sp. E02]|nr:hypothetical protein CKK34_6095 [Yarrowia sp. E02]